MLPLQAFSLFQHPVAPHHRAEDAEKQLPGCCSKLCMSEVLLLEPPEQLVESPYSFKVLAILQTGHSLVVEADKVFVDI